ncbi:ankyrin and armadillo repeat-containing protein-like [Branchiostoma floridae x Branchiostoma japonicum]
MSTTSSASPSRRPSLLPGGMDEKDKDEAYLAQLQATRNANQFFEKFDRAEVQEMLAYTSSHWLLSSDDLRFSVEPPDGLVSKMRGISYSNCIFLLPEVPNCQPYDCRELHQIIRDLVTGIFALNQVPCISLEANFDQSTSCKLPPAYHDTRVGQILINLDYMMKALWHGAFFPPDKRAKFSERWRSNLDVNASGKPETKKNVLLEFTTAGMMDVSKDPEYAQVYGDQPETEKMKDEHATLEERKLFMRHVENFSLQMTVYQTSVQQHKNLFLMESDWNIAQQVRISEDRIDQQSYLLIQRRLQMHQEMIKKHLEDKAEVRRLLGLVKFISFMVPFLVAMRRRMKVPDMSRLLAPFIDDKLRTERELPPLMLGPDFKCKNFFFENRYHHLHGGISIDLETGHLVDPPDEVVDAFDELQLEAATHCAKLLDPDAPYMEHYPLPVVELNGKRYHIFSLDFETYYPQSPHKPRWIHAFYDVTASLKPKRLPLTDIQVHEHFKKRFGYKKAIRYKNLQYGLKASAQRGLVAIFQTLCRKCPATRLAKHDELGLSLLHHAAIHNRPQVIALLLLQGLDVNVRRLVSHYTTASSGPTSLHLAAQCGSLDALSCLVSCKANITMSDQDGWAPVHHAAYYNNVQCLKHLINKDSSQLELNTTNQFKSTPLLLAASSGALAAVQHLLAGGADITKHDTKGDNVVHLAALQSHTNVLEYLILMNCLEVPVWKLLVGMLQSEEEDRKLNAVRSLDILSVSGEEHWKDMLAAGSIPALVELLKDESEILQALAASVLCNISEHEPVRREIANANATPVLIRLLGSAVDDIQSRSAVILSDLACVDDNQESISAQGGIPPLVHLLESELEDVLVNAVNALRVLCTGNHGNQSTVAENCGLEPLVEFLGVDSDILKAAAAAALASICAGHKDNQDKVVDQGAVRPLVELVWGRNVTVQVKAASALEAIAENNSTSQAAILDLDAPKYLNKLLKVWSVEVKEQGACTLWALAGSTPRQQRMIAEKIGIPQLIDMLLLKSEKLQYVGCLAIIALSRSSIEYQNKICRENGIQPLVRLLRSPKTSETVLLTVIKALGTLCIGVAHSSNKVTQGKIAEEQAISTLCKILGSTSNEILQVEIVLALSCISLNNKDIQEVLKEEETFSPSILLQLFHSSNKDVQLRAGTALSTYVFNNTANQYKIRQLGGIPLAIFEPFLLSENEAYQAHASFHVVVLARVIVDQDQVMLTARGVTQLVELLQSDDDNTVVLAASLMGSLAHTRAGIPDAMVTCGAVELLTEHLSSHNDQVRFYAAVALGYLTFNRTAGRELLVLCRNTPGLYDVLVENMGQDARISMEFTDTFRMAKMVGLPSQSLEINGGPPIQYPGSRGYARPYTAIGLTSTTKVRDKPGPRTVSAPAIINTRDRRRREKSAMISVSKSMATLTHKEEENGGRSSRKQPRASSRVKKAWT